MLRMISDKEKKENIKRLNKFVKNNYCDMYNHMLSIEGFLSKGEHDELQRIVAVISKLKINKETKQKIIDAIKEKSIKEMKQRIKKFHGEKTKCAH